MLSMHSGGRPFEWVSTCMSGPSGVGGTTSHRDYSSIALGMILWARSSFSARYAFYSFVPWGKLNDLL